MLEKITRRGPKAYAIFEAILREKYPDAFDILNHVSYLNDEHFNDISIRRANSRPGPANQSPPNQNILNHLIDQNQQQNEMNGNHIENRPNVNDDLENAIAIQPSTSVARDTYNRANELTLTEFTDPVQPRLQFHVRKSTHAHGLEPGNKIPVYPMNSKNRGVLFLVNIINFEAKKFRKGAHADSDNLITLFREMGFKIFCYEDLTKTVSEMEIMKLFIKNKIKYSFIFLTAIYTIGWTTGRLEAFKTDRLFSAGVIESWRT